MDLTDRISFSKSFDLAGQNKVLKDPGQVYIGKTINIDRFLVGFGIFWGSFGDDQEIFWMGPWLVLACKNRLLFLFFKKSMF